MGPEGALLCLDAGANDLGGVLMNESITRAAGAAHGQEISAAEMRRLIASIGREAYQRSTDYREVVGGRPRLTSPLAGEVAGERSSTVGEGIIRH